MAGMESSVQTSEGRAQGFHRNWMRAAGKVIISISVGTVKIGVGGIFTISTVAHCIPLFTKYFLAYPVFLGFIFLTTLKRLYVASCINGHALHMKLRFREVKQSVQGYPMISSKYWPFDCEHQVYTLLHIVRSSVHTHK